MTGNKNYTSIEQSKRLLELGLNPESADMFYFLDPTPVGNIYHLIVKRVDIGVKNLPKYNEGDIPCWSVGALLEILRYHEDCNFLNLYTNKASKWLISTSYYDSVWKEYQEVNINLIDACYSMVVWLLENKHI